VADLGEGPRVPALPLILGKKIAEGRNGGRASKNK